MLLTETWLDKVNTTNILIESAPLDLNFISSPREDRRRGKQQLYLKIFQCKRMTFGNFLFCLSSLLLLSLKQLPDSSFHFLIHTYQGLNWRRTHKAAGKKFRKFNEVQKSVHRQAGRQAGRGTCTEAFTSLYCNNHYLNKTNLYEALDL